MENNLTLYNSLSRKKEKFEPIKAGMVGMYVCGPTVYSDVHLGNCRSFVSFDIIYRYLMHSGYKVRYVRNITDVGHLVGDVDTGAEDKIAKKARLEQLEPMEVVQHYANGFHEMMRIFNVLPPSIEPRATAHIIEQIEMVQDIIDNGFAYERNGSVYFDTPKFIKEKGIYGDLSGRKVDELLEETRELKNQSEKNDASDFAIWIKAAPEHIMRWKSPWSVGFPGWHLECSVMSTKYLGKTFDIHGGGSDLKFPHHENEIAQNVGACNCAPANYWMHGNMLLMNGRKMSKSDNNSITPEQLFSGNSEHISKGYSPNEIRFFMLQTHYRSTLDLTDEGLQAAEKGYKRMMEAQKTLSGMSSTTAQSDSALNKEINGLLDDAITHMNDDFNTPRALASLFELVTKINGLRDGHLKMEEVATTTLGRMKTTYHSFIYDIFGLKDEASEGAGSGVLDGLMSLILDIRADSREKKDWGTSDKIRDTLKELEITVKDGKEGTTWAKD